MLLAGKKVVVVGGSSGIGLATAEMAKAQGAEVIIASRSADKVKAAAAKVGGTGIVCDVTNDDSVVNLFKTTGAVDHVVVSAAQLKSGPFKTVSMEDVRSTLEGKFWGAWRVARAAEIKAGGSLTLVSGFLSIRPRPNSAIVGASNGALESLARALALELAPVRVNCVSPGYAGSRAQGHAGQDRRLAAGWPGRPWRRHRRADSGLHGQRICHRGHRLCRWRRFDRRIMLMRPAFFAFFAPAATFPKRTLNWQKPVNL
jgi:NAD(P)-dependent dehydrogenase (short-subunit alcohol dehydrogenase family)